MQEFNWNDLKFFLTLVRAGNPMKAAKILGVDHTTVRRRIGALEESLKARLFTKLDEQYVLTTQGDALLRASERIETEITAVSDDLTDDSRVISGVVRLGAADALGSFFLAPLLVRLQSMHPALRVELVAMSRQFNLTKREADIAIVVARPAQGRHYIRKLLDCRLHLFASPKYLALHQPITCLQDLRGHAFIGYTDQFDFNPELDPKSVIYDDLVKPGFASTNLVAQLHACAAGGGICLLPRYATEQIPSLVPVLKEEFRIEREIWLLIHSDLRNIARYRVTSSFIIQEINRARHLFS